MRDTCTFDAAQATDKLYSDSMCVRLEGDQNKNVVVKVQNIQHYVRPDDSIGSDTLTCEFLVGTPEDKVLATAKHMYSTLDMKEELQILFRPQGAVTSKSMSQENINLLVQSAHLEYMGALSETAQLLQILFCPQGAVTAKSMSQENINLLVQSARLEYMGALSETAQLLDWVVCGPDIHGRFVYMNHTLQKAVQCTADIYNLHTEIRQHDKAER